MKMQLLKIHWLPRILSQEIFSKNEFMDAIWDIIKSETAKTRPEDEEKAYVQLQ